ncbi:MAG: ATP-sensitive inward rectifier potassium channel 10 [Myxococcales bacterium]|nr:hypothetical protein [Myxococcales bacterium]MCB9717329.1 ATP-sensitive inward rectifier potassium channel 10 [Myxococcales bacterium]
MAPPLGPADPQNAVRIGLRLSPLTDLYYHLMNGSWWLLIGVLGLAYMLANLIFAGLYMLQTDGIASASGSFADAFAFSVQTLSTIGYGTLSPISGPVHTIVAFEAMVGLLGTAIATGLVFAKFARPRAKVMFSDTMLVYRRDGRPVLVFRVGNARGNEIIEASLRVSSLVPEITSEGEQMRRLVDLRLLRSTTPMFAMTWTVIHELDEQSPLRDYDEQRLREEGVRFIVSLTGIDATFSQTVHARHIYDHSHVLWWRRFVDVVGSTDDGRLVIDYRRFHDTVAVGEDGTPGTD